MSYVTIVPEKKLCATCLKNLPATDYTLRRSHGKLTLESSCRSCRAAAKRAARRLEADKPKEPPTSIYRKRIPAERLLPLLDLWAIGRTQLEGDTESSTIWRTYNAFRSGEKPDLAFDAADRLLVAIGFSHEWHCSLADLYESGPAERSALPSAHSGPVQAVKRGHNLSKQKEAA